MIGDGRADRTFLFCHTQPGALLRSKSKRLGRNGPEPQLVQINVVNGTMGSAYTTWESGFIFLLVLSRSLFHTLLYTFGCDLFSNLLFFRVSTQQFCVVDKTGSFLFQCTWLPISASDCQHSRVQSSQSVQMRVLLAYISLKHIFITRISLCNLS